MTTLDSSSVESSMDNHHLEHKHQKAISNDAVVDGKEGDPEVWKTFNRNFLRVQSVLDRNKILIKQVNVNHKSKIPDNMVKNVALIQEINGNISKVVSLYSNLSANFSTTYHQRNKNCTGANAANTGGE